MGSKVGEGMNLVIFGDGGVGWGVAWSQQRVSLTQIVD